MRRLLLRVLFPCAVALDLLFVAPILGTRESDCRALMPTDQRPT